MDLQKNKSQLLTDNEQPIIALCTPRGSGAIALIRLCGPTAVAVVDSFAQLSSGKKLVDCATHTIHHGFVVPTCVRTEPVEVRSASSFDKLKMSANTTHIDSVLFLLMKAPKTFTGQDTVEITCHNNPFIIDRIIEIAIQAGARQAHAGEFTRRAFLNKKIDLVQAEAVADVIHAQSEEALVRSMATLEGSLSHAIASIKNQIVTLLAFVEASFEFLDEEQRDFDFDHEIKRQLEAIQEFVASVKKDYPLQQQIKEGLRLVILGSVNVGKSTLFNALLDKERAIVSPIAGTTRDSIDATVYKNGAFWSFVDTAGLRQTGDIIEQQGIERSMQQASMADVIVLVLDGSAHLLDHEQKEYQKILDLYESKSIIVINKIDKNNKIEQHQHPLITKAPVVYTSAHCRKGLDTLEHAIEEKKQSLFSQCETPFLLNQRQCSLLGQIEQDLGSLALQMRDSLHYELVAYQLHNLGEKASELTGEKVSEQVLDTIFNQFCVGK